MRIGEAAAASGTSVRSLRFYEDEGLIVPGRLGNGYRDFCRSTIDRVVVIRTLLEAGLPVRLVREALDDADSAELVAGVREHRDRLVARVLSMQDRIAALDDFLAVRDEGAARRP